jgi:hypothetical protein
VISRNPFAIDLSALACEPREPGTVACRVSAVWFRRRKRVLQACAGSLHGWFGDGRSAGSVPQDAGEFALLADRRSTWTSADCQARWDGKTFWAASPMGIELQRAYLELLEPMLAGYPAAPGDYDSWWRFTDAF